MKLTITSCIALLCLANIECGTIKKLVGTAAREINEIADVIEEAVSNATDKLNENKPVKIIDSDASRNVGNSTRQTVSTDEIVSDATGQAERDEKVQVNIEINLVVNYQTKPNNVTIKAQTDGKDDKNEPQTGAGNVHTETTTKRTTDNAPGVDIGTENNKKDTIDRVTYQYSGSDFHTAIISNKKDDASRVDRITGNNLEQTNEVEITTVGAAMINPNIVFPGPSSKVTRNDSGFAVLEARNDVNTISNDSGVVTEKVEITTRVDQILFPDSAGNRATETASCPDGLVMTEKGYCLKPIDGPKNRKNGLTRMLFEVGCIEGYARALDGSCQPMLYD